MRLKIGSSVFNKHRVATTAHVPLGSDPTAVVLPVPYVHQEHINMCGDACVEMLRQYRGLSFPQIDMTKNPRGAFEGATANDILGAYSTHLRRFTGFSNPASFTSAFVKAELNRVGPLMCSGQFVRLLGKIRSGHWILLIGIAGETVVIHDPWHGASRHKPLSWFTSLLDAEEVLVLR